VADIKLVCPDCDYECAVSEHVSAVVVKCPMCNAQIPVPHVERESVSLSVKGNGSARPEPEEAPPPQQPSPASLDDLPVSAIRDVYRVREKVKRPLAIWGWVAFLVVAGLLVGMQSLAKGSPEMTRNYVWVRAVVGGFVYLLIVILAYEDGLLHGFLCLFLPPYAVYYALARTEYYFLKGAFTALAVVVAAELYLLPQSSALNSLQDGLTRSIEHGERLIQWAGSSPTFK
jgi:hypothetical protein